MSCKREQSRSAGGRLALGLTLALTVGFLSGCEGLLDVELPGDITSESLEDPSQARALVNSAIGEFECGYSEFIATNAAGAEDVMVRVTGWWGGSLEYEPEPDAGGCNTAYNAYGWWEPIQAGRYMAENVYQNISEEWEAEAVQDRDELLAQSAIYAGAAYNLLGEHFCEMAADTGPLMTPDETLGVSEQYLSDALDHIDSAGDFEMPFGIAPSAETMALLLRARVRFARGDSAGAATDIESAGITPGSEAFTAWVTRDAGGERSRWNRVVDAHNNEGWGTIIGPVDWWTGTGWPDTIPFTGYQDLAIDETTGRAVTDEGYPITLDDAGAVADTRVPVTPEIDAEGDTVAFNNIQSFRQEKYEGLDSNIPLVGWEEAWLIMAQIEGGQDAIDRVNDIREAHDLPVIAGDYESALLGDADALHDMIIEERRRALFLEGRFWSTKIRNTDKLWFPRGVGRTNYPYSYQGAVRMALPEDEFDLNPNFDQSQQGTLCPPDQQPEL